MPKPPIPAASVAITLPLEDGPAFLNGLLFERSHDDRLQVTVMKRSGSDYGAAYITRAELLKILDMLGITE